MSTVARNPLAGTLAITSRIFETWAGDEPRFVADFEALASILWLRSGIAIATNTEELHSVRRQWLLVRQAWLDRLMPAGTTHLSHYKDCAILLDAFCSREPLAFAAQSSPTRERHRELRVVDPQDGLEQPSLPNQLSEEQCKRLVDGGKWYVGWLLAYEICQHFERYRDDRRDPFEARITARFEHDVVSALIGGKVTAQALDLILTALFLRD